LQCLQLKFPDQPIDNHYHLEDICDAAQFILYGTLTDLANPSASIYSAILTNSSAPLCSSDLQADGLAGMAMRWTKIVWVVTQIEAEDAYPWKLHQPRKHNTPYHYFLLRCLYHYLSPSDLQVAQ
jgi:hypothetical protein